MAYLFSKIVLSNEKNNSSWRRIFRKSIKTVHCNTFFCVLLSKNLCIGPQTKDQKHILNYFLSKDFKDRNYLLFSLLKINFSEYVSHFLQGTSISLLFSFGYFSRSFARYFSWSSIIKLHNPYNRPGRFSLATDQCLTLNKWN